MPEELEDDCVRDFIRSFQAKYEEESILSDVCDVKVYQERFSEIYGSVGIGSHTSKSGEHSGLEYRQVGSRTKTPINILNSGKPMDIINSFAKSLRLGERKYILSELDRESNQERVNTVTFEDASYSNFQKWCDELKNPDHLFLPLDAEFHRAVLNWGPNKIHSSRGEIAISGSDVVQVHWIPLDADFDNGYLISSEGMTVVRKWFGDSDVPSGFEHDTKYDEFSLNRPLMIYIGKEVIEDQNEEEEKFKQKVDFLYRVVLSELILNNGHAIKLVPTKELSSDL